MENTGNLQNILESVYALPMTVLQDMEQFINKLEAEPFDAGMLKNYGVSNRELIDRLRDLYRM